MYVDEGLLGICEDFALWENSGVHVDGYEMLGSNPATIVCWLARLSSDQLSKEPSIIESWLQTHAFFYIKIFRLSISFLWIPNAGQIFQRFVRRQPRRSRSTRLDQTDIRPLGHILRVRITQNPLDLRALQAFDPCNLPGAVIHQRPADFHIGFNGARGSR